MLTDGNLLAINSTCVTIIFLFADGETATFDGESRITYDISGENQFVQTRSDHFKMRFQTNYADGLMIYADSNQGDHFVLEMIRGQLYFHINLGTVEPAMSSHSYQSDTILWPCVDPMLVQRL